MLFKILTIIFFIFYAASLIKILLILNDYAYI